MKRILILLVLFISLGGFSQTDQSNYYLIENMSLEFYSSKDSSLVKAALDRFHAAESDTGRINALSKICDEMMHDDWIKYQYYQYDLIQKALHSKPNDKELKVLNKSLSGALVNIGYINKIRGNIDKALEYYERALKLQRKISDKDRMAQTLNNIGVIYKNQGNLPGALETYHEALKIQEELKDNQGISSSYFNIGSIYFSQQDYGLALEYYEKSLEVDKIRGSKRGISNSYNNIGAIYNEIGDRYKALSYFKKALSLKKEIGEQAGIIDTYINLGITYQALGNDSSAIQNYSEALRISEITNNAEGLANSYIRLAKYKYSYGEILGEEGALAYAQKGLKVSEEIGFTENIRDASEILYRIYEKLGKYEQSLKMHRLFVLMKDSVSNLENHRSLTRRQAQYGYEKQKAIDDLQHDKQIAIEVEEKEKQKILVYASVFGLLLVIAFLIYAVNRLKVTRKQKRTIEDQKKEVDQAYAELNFEKEKSEELLLNILPQEVAEELKEKGAAEAKMMDDVTVLFTDFKGFTKLSEELSAKELVNEINTCFSAFDKIMEKHGVEKIKTIGDAYMAAGGLPVPNLTHAMNVVEAALDIQEFMLRMAEQKKKNGESYFEIRIGVHTGPVVAGIVGLKKFQYDIWGDTVNTASRMESSGEVGKVNISATTYNQIRNLGKFTFESRGEIEAKGKGKLQMYFVERRR